MGHIGEEPKSPKISISTYTEFVPSTSIAKPTLKFSGSGKGDYDKMEIKPRFDGMYAFIHPTNYVCLSEGMYLTLF